MLCLSFPLNHSYLAIPLRGKWVNICVHNSWCQPYPLLELLFHKVRHEVHQRVEHRRGVVVVHGFVSSGVSSLKVNRHTGSKVRGVYQGSTWGPPQKIFYDNLRCCQWSQSCHRGDFRFSVTGSRWVQPPPTHPIATFRKWKRIQGFAKSQTKTVLGSLTFN